MRLVRRFGAADARNGCGQDAGAWSWPRSRRQNTKSCTRPRGRKLATANSRRGRKLPSARSGSGALKEQSAFRDIGKGNVPLVDLFDITTAKRCYGQDAMLPGMKFALHGRASAWSAARFAAFDATRDHEGRGRGKSRQDRSDPAPAKFMAGSGGVRGDRENTWAALKGRGRAQDHLG